MRFETRREPLTEVMRYLVDDREVTQTEWHDAYRAWTLALNKESR